MCAFCPHCQVKYPDLQLTIARDAWSSAEYDTCPLQRLSLLPDVALGASDVDGGSTSPVRGVCCLKDNVKCKACYRWHMCICAVIFLASVEAH
jgi:hypothetical protein